ncbi:MAG: esterase family protein [Myxococcales bacterium]|nr:esterase family protein [Myxococcales bacterium]MCB9644431.1 esterase family protein [Myxococcales bacterium]
MYTEEHFWRSPRLDQKMAMRVYGHYGRPLLVFPTSGGRYFEYEDFGMIEAIRPFIEEGRIKVFAVDSVDRQSWLDRKIQPAEKARRHELYDQYIAKEVIPFIHAHCHGPQPILTTGCSLGAYHAANFFFRYPKLFNGTIALSGVYRAAFSVGDYMDGNVYFNSPIDYLARLNDPQYLEAYRHAKIVLCVGLGAWEERMIRDTRIMQSILQQKHIPAIIDYWGHDVEHHWFWWRQQMPYFLGRILP